jgi:hypothetical protein
MAKKDDGRAAESDRRIPVLGQVDAFEGQVPVKGRVEHAADAEEDHQSAKEQGDGKNDAAVAGDSCLWRL